MRKQADPVSTELYHAFINYTNEYQLIPDDTRDFAAYAGITVDEFKAVAGDIKQLHQQVWQYLFQQTIHRLVSEDVYEEYVVREKVLALFFTLIEVLKPHRYFVRLSVRRSKKSLGLLNYFELMEEDAMEFFEDLIHEAKSVEEVRTRPGIDMVYDKALWVELQYIVNFWIDDHSTDFERTDAAIEKVVNLAFDAMGYNVLDSMFDLGKFWWNNGK